VTTACCCERVVYILIICVDYGSFFTDCEFENTDMEGTHSIARGGGCIRLSYTSISEMVSKSSLPTFLKM